LCTHVGVELAHEGGEVAVLEVLGEEVAGELGGAPHHEGRAGVVPRDGVVGAGVLHHRVRLRQERRRPRRRRRHWAGDDSRAERRGEGRMREEASVSTGRRTRLETWIWGLG
jgi:hypothetical protein